jgi:DNA-binding SARP family transcriptional activator
MLSVSLLGDFCIKHDNASVSGIDTPRLQSLLAYLMLHRDAPQSRSHLAFLFWPDTSEAQAHTNLRNLLHHLRRALPNADSFLDTKVQTLQWRYDASFSLDVANFEDSLAHLEQARKTNDSIAAREALEQAVSLYRGDLVPSCYDDWIIPQREGLHQAFLNALEHLICMLEDQRDYQAAIVYAQNLLRYDPLHEATYRRLIRIHALNGDRAGALRVYHTCTTILQRELDVEPSAVTQEAYVQLLGAESQPSSTVPTTIAFSPLVGRQSEWMQLLKAWNEVAGGGAPQVVVLSGVAGIGKTRLVEELLQWAARQGISRASTRCYAAEGALAYSPVTTWLRANPLVPLEDVWLAEVARLLPEIFTQRSDLPRPVALTEAWQRQRLFEALSRAILGLNQPILLTIDDLQWCDRDTLEWLHFLLRFDRCVRLLIAGTYRPEEIDHTHPLVSSLQALRLDEQVTEIDLPPLDEGATQTLASLVAGMEIGVTNAQILYRETEGNPLFVVETVRAGLAAHEQRLNIDSARRFDTSSLGDINLPPKVKSVIERRLAQISTPARELAELAATIGREFSVMLLTKASGCEEDTLVRELDELWQRRIIREHGADAYDFSHDKLREAAYRGMSIVHRRLFHSHIAKALETLHANELNPVCHQIAVHYERAGLPEQAIPFYLRAARVERQVYANEEALALIKRGLALVEEVGKSEGGSEGSNEVITQLWEELADILELRAQHEEALQAYTSAQAHVPGKDRVWQARLHRKAGVTLREKRFYMEALAACNRAEIALGKQLSANDSFWWMEWIEVQVERVWAHYWLAQWPEMEALVNRVQPLVQESGRSANRARFLMASILMHLRRERYEVSDEMLTVSYESLVASQEWGDLKTRVECQFEFGFLHLWRRELDEAEENLQATLKLAETSGIVPMQVLSLTYLTVLYRFRNQVDEVLDHVLLAQAAAGAAKMPDYVAAARGNQAWLAWRSNDLTTAEQKGQESLEMWHQSPLVYPFQWQALWPLIGVVLAQCRDDEVWDYIQKLLEPTQQFLPDELNTTLEAAVQAKIMNQTDVARSHLDRAVVLAREMGYL